MTRFALTPRPRLWPILAGTTEAQIARWRAAALADWKRTLIKNLRRKCPKATVDGIAGPATLVVALPQVSTSVLNTLRRNFDCTARAVAN